MSDKTTYKLTLTTSTKPSNKLGDHSRYQHKFIDLQQIINLSKLNATKSKTIIFWPLLGMKHFNPIGQ